MLMKMRNTKGFTLVELMIVVAIIGILAAIAIPAFLRSVKKSKTSEAEGIMRKVGDGAKSYFTSEQRRSAATGDQPWHVAGTTLGAANSPGMPVTWANYVFPGGALGGFFTADTSRPIATATDDAPYSHSTVCSGSGTAPTGGSKNLPNAAFYTTPDAGISTVLNKLNISFQDPMYFEYTYMPGGTGQTARADIAACANFNSNGALAHTITQTILVPLGTQEVQLNPASTENEFE